MTKKKRILIIDDDVASTRLLKLNLEQTNAYEWLRSLTGLQLLPTPLLPSRACLLIAPFLIDLRLQAPTPCAPSCGPGALSGCFFGPAGALVIAFSAW